MRYPFRLVPALPVSGDVALGVRLSPVVQPAIRPAIGSVLPALPQALVWLTADGTQPSDGLASVAQRYGVLDATLVPANIVDLRGVSGEASFMAQVQNPTGVVTWEVSTVIALPPEDDPVVNHYDSGAFNVIVDHSVFGPSTRLVALSGYPTGPTYSLVALLDSYALYEIQIGPFTITAIVDGIAIGSLSFHSIGEG